MTILVTLLRYMHQLLPPKKSLISEKEQMNLLLFSWTWLLGKVNIISDSYVTKDWNTIVCDVKNRDQIAKYVVGNVSSLNLLAGKIIKANCEAVMNSIRLVCCIV